MSNATITSQSAGDAAEIHLHAYNAAFYELGLRWYWDSSTYQHPLPDAHERRRIRIYLETRQPHLLKAYDADFLIDAIQVTKARCYEMMTACGCKAAPCVNWAEIQKTEVGV
jgi:hypothetical protein